MANRELLIPRVIDNFLSSDEIELASINLKRPIWEFGWQANAALGKNHFWHTHFLGGNFGSREDCSLDLSKNPSLSWLYEIWLKVKSSGFDGNILSRVYANAHTFGLDGSIHRDSADGEGGETAIIYLHQYWPISWGGETVFYSKDYRDIVFSTPPYPGRAVFFDGSIPHMARSPSKECPELRISLVFKTFRQ